MPAGGTACSDLVWSEPILDCIPVCCHSWGYSQERVVMAQLVVGAKRALIVHILPVFDSGQPFVQKATWTLVRAPPHTKTTAGCHLLVSQMLLFGMMPLPLQRWLDQADVWAC